MKEFHILNGDALEERFPDSVNGDIIVARECLVDGNVSAHSLDELFEMRASYLSEAYNSTEDFYFGSVVPEFEKIISLPSGSVINLWFEDDLFCQVNMWFVCSLIEEYVTPQKVFLIRPHTDIQYGFGALNSKGLKQIYSSGTELSEDDIKLFSTLWKLYQKDEHSEIVKLAKQNSTHFAFLLETAEANLNRFPENGALGRPKRSLLNIMTELNTNDFAPVFQEFHKRESIYGFGDLQVKRMFDQLKSS